MSETQENTNNNSNTNQIGAFQIGTVIKHSYLGSGRVLGYDQDFYVIQFKGEIKKVPFSYKEMSTAEQQTDTEYKMIKRAVREVLGDFGWIETELELGKRWQGGNIVINAGKPDVKPKEIPIEVFFKKIIGVREKLRVLEQKINNHPNLSQADKLEMQGYITRSYGSLTTFNVLFAEDGQEFSGSGE